MANDPPPDLLALGPQVLSQHMVLLSLRKGCEAVSEKKNALHGIRGLLYMTNRDLHAVYQRNRERALARSRRNQPPMKTYTLADLAKAMGAPTTDQLIKSIQEKHEVWEGFGIVEK